MHRFDLDFTVMVAASFSLINSIYNPRCGGLPLMKQLIRARALCYASTRSASTYNEIANSTNVFAGGKMMIRSNGLVVILRSLLVAAAAASTVPGTWM